MRYLHLVWRSLWRKRTRTILTILSIVVAFILYGMLSAFRGAFAVADQLAEGQRLIVVSKVSMIQTLPIGYEERIRQVKGVASVTHSNWFGGYYQEPRNQFGQFPVEADAYLATYPELRVAPEERAAFIRNRNSALVGRDIARTYRLKVGDPLPIMSTIYAKTDGSRQWDFVVAGIFDNRDPAAGTGFMLMNYAYFNEARTLGKDTVGWFIVRPDGTRPAVEIARDIDTAFANSPAETKTGNEAAFAEEYTKQFGDIGLIVMAILGAVFFTILLVTANTMAQSVRERIAEVGVLKTLGFTDGTVLGIVLGEGMLVAAMGGLAGLVIAAGLMPGLSRAMGTMMPSGIHLRPLDYVIGLLLVAGLGVVSGVFPAVHAMRLTIIQALGRH